MPNRHAARSPAWSALVWPPEITFPSSFQTPPITPPPRRALPTISTRPSPPSPSVSAASPFSWQQTRGSGAGRRWADLPFVLLDQPPEDPLHIPADRVEPLPPGHPG